MVRALTKVDIDVSSRRIFVKLALSEPPRIFILSHLAMDWSSLESGLFPTRTISRVQLILQDGELSDLSSPDVLRNDDKILVTLL